MPDFPKSLTPTTIIRNSPLNSSILVTGCAGFIGSQVALQLCDQHRVVGVDDVNDYYDQRLKEYRLNQLAAQETFQFQQVSLEDKGQVDRLFEEHEFACVINLAARAGVRYSMENPYVYLTANVNGTLNLLEAMRRHGVMKFVLASTSSLYAGQAMPFVETLPVNEPISTYAASKKSAELMAHAYHHMYAMDVSIVRYFTVYGPAGRPDMSYFRFIKNIYKGDPITIYGDGEQSRDFTYITDIAAGTLLAMKEVGYEIFNLGSGAQPKTINQIVARIETLLGRRAIIEYQPAHKTDLRSTWADNSKARDMLGWQPNIDIDTGLAQCVDWFLSNLPWSADIGAECYSIPVESAASDQLC